MTSFMKNEVYASRFHVNKPKYLWWKFEPISPSGDVILENGTINYELYNRYLK